MMIEEKCPITTSTIAAKRRKRAEPKNQYTNSVRKVDKRSRPKRRVRPPANRLSWPALAQYHAGSFKAVISDRELALYEKLHGSDLKMPDPRVNVAGIALELCAVAKTLSAQS